MSTSEPEPSAATPFASFARELQQAKSRKTYCSFGDNGITATVGASGRLLQISRHFPGQRVGFCVDHPSVQEPYRVAERARKLLSWAAEPSRIYAIDPSIIPSDSWDEPQSINFVHNRWPVFDRTRPGWGRVKTGYVVSGATVYQIHDFDCSESCGTNSSPQLLMRDGLLIRDLDFVDAHNTFNLAEKDDQGYSSKNSSDCFVREHEFKGAGEEETRTNEGGSSVVLSISCFNNDKSVKFVQVKGDYYKVEWDEGALDSFKKDGKVKFTIAYTMSLVSPGNFPQGVSPNDACAASESLHAADIEYPELAKDAQLDGVLRRNLEHILSVCSIPTSIHEEDKTTAIALTCGDFDGHRVAPAASFYSFQFLLLAWEQFDPKKFHSRVHGPEVLSYIKTMRDRIERVCMGHMIWLFLRHETLSESRNPHRWVNGDPISEWKDNKYLPAKSLVDMPFRIIMAGDFYKLFEGFNKRFGAQENPLESVKKTIGNWIRNLDQTNRQRLYAFPRYRNESTRNYYFTDHAMIWWAIKSTEQLGLKSQLFVPTVTDSKSALYQKVLEARKSGHDQFGKGFLAPTSYSADLFRSQIIKRFTTENPVSKRRMIAVSRSPAQTRFLLRTRDASLFHVMSLGLFDKPGMASSPGSWHNKIDVWRNTVDCQMAHEDNDDANWDEPLRFALAIVMAHHGKSINLRQVGEMRNHAMSVLLQSTSASGLFPGKLDENNEPAIYEAEVKRDTYWGVTFEIPFLLWKYSHSAYETQPAPQSSVGSHSFAEIEFGRHIQSQPNESMDTQLSAISADPKEKVNVTIGPPGYSMKHAFRFNNIVDQDNIVELADEWLYNKPAFFVPSLDTAADVDINVQEEHDIHEDSIIHEDARIKARPYIDREVVSMLQREISDHEEYMLREGLQELRASVNANIKDGTQEMRQLLLHVPLNLHAPDFVGAMVNVAKSKHLKRDLRNLEDSMTELTSFLLPKDQMKKGRTPLEAKKRLWVFMAYSPSDNESPCLQTSPFHSPDSEQNEQETVEDKQLSVFCDRHKAYCSFFMDDTIPVLNSWTTELHLSCYKIAKTSTLELVKEVPRIGPLHLPGFEGDSSTQLSKVVMSFRFEGDFFDRYWTCWFLKADSRMTTTPRTIKNDVAKLLREPLVSKKDDDLKKQPWRQRKVLELLLFDEMVHQIYEYTEEILERVERSRLSITKQPRGAQGMVDVTVQDADEVDYDTFMKRRKQIGQSQDVLQAVQEELSDCLAKIDHWLRREEERQAERPRWSFNDESRYRGVISKLVISNEHNIQKLRHSHSKIVSFNDSLAKNLEIMRSDVEQRRADDIQRFTYVTVVFLPLGFATGVFSMSGAPAGGTLGYMILLAVGALLVTGLLLENTKSVERLYQWVSQPFRQSVRRTLVPMRPAADDARGDAHTSQATQQGKRRKMDQLFKRSGGNRGKRLEEGLGT